MSETDIVRIVEQGQNDHGLMLTPEGPQPGSTPGDFTGIEDKLKSETPVTGKITFEYDHWQTSLRNTNDAKKAYDQAFEGWHTSTYMAAASQAVTKTKVQLALRSFGIAVKSRDLTLSDDGPTATPGSFYYAGFENLSVPECEPPVPHMRDPMMMELWDGDTLQTATHATSLEAATESIAARLFTEARNKTENKSGVYCEGAHRRHNTTGYSTLNFAKEDSDDLTLYSAFFELAVNRCVGKTANGQWVQPPDSILITGMHIHCLPVTKMYTAGFTGWWTLAPTVFASIGSHRFLRDRQVTTVPDNEIGAGQGIRIPNPGQQRSSSQPPLKIARHEAAAPIVDDDSSSDSWESVNSSDAEVDSTTEKLAKVSLEHGPVRLELDKILPQGPQAR